MFDFANKNIDLLDERKIFIQIGASRDGLDYYLDCAHRRNFNPVLIETPHYLDLRKDLSRRQYESEIAIEDPSDVSEIVRVLWPYRNRIALILPGFDCYVSAAYSAAQQLMVSPYRMDDKNKFVSLDKYEQRYILRESAPAVMQPHFEIVKRNYKDLLNDNYMFPLVVKPINGAGGLGVYLVNNVAELAESVEIIFNLTNYNGVSFDKIIVEEYVQGTEMSIQGVCFNGLPIVLSFCEKVIKIENTQSAGNIQCFREAGHVAIPGNQLSEDVYQFVQDVIRAFNYNFGPFHLDFIVSDGKPYFIEAGYRLSGGTLVELVQRMININWAELSFSSYLQEKSIDTYSLVKHKYNCMWLSTVQNKSALRIAENLKKNGELIDIQLIDTNISDIAKQRQLHAQLFADMSRHGSGVGKLWFRGSSKEEILGLIRKCQGID